MIFLPFGVNSSTSSLPVEWLHFGVRREAQNAILEWEIAPAKNLAYFSVERSQDAKSFQKLDDIKPSTQTTYRFVDREPGQSQVYYRIKQTDWDGQISYTAVRSLYFGQAGVPQFYPNPFANEIQLDLRAWTSQSGRLKIYDSQGRLVVQQSWPEKSTQLKLAGLAPLSSGVYYVHLQTANAQFRMQLVKH
ncbi:MAG: T9SS type A sorting domain-containing protein [Bacteroidia bacterium]